MRFDNRSSGSSDAGFFSMDALGGLLVFLILIPLLTVLWRTGVDAIKKRAVADHFLTVQRAAFDYGKLFHSVLAASVTPTTGPNITIDDLKAADCLPDTFNGANAWNQNYQITARQDDTGRLAMIVLTTGGRGHSAQYPDFANLDVPETAAIARIGFIPTGLVGASNVIRGAYGGWEVPLADMGLAAAPGHLASISTYSSDDLGQDYLYRVAVPDHPELNAMQTSLDMTDHDINNVRTLDFAPHDYASMTDFCTTPDDEGRTFLDASAGLYLCRDGRIVVLGDSGNSTLMQNAQLVSDAQLIDKPTCADGAGLHPEIFVAPSIASSGAESPVAASFQAWATNFSDEQWQVHLRLLNARNEWVYPSSNYGRMIAFATCARD
jgi:hypothetical protein